MPPASEVASELAVAPALPARAPPRSPIPGRPDPGLAARALGGLEALAPAGPPSPPAAWNPRAYGALVRQRIDAHKRYPARARRQELEGASVIAVTVRADGHLAAPPRLVRSSGVSALDREALRMARAAAPFPPPAVQGPLTFEVPVHFSLSEL